MRNRLKYILDVGSSCIRLLAVLESKEPRILAESEVLYDGYMDGEFLSLNKLGDDLSKLIVDMAIKVHKPIKSMIIGVPSEFCLTICKRISRKYINPHKITQLDIVNLFEANANFSESKDYSVINFSPMKFVLDDEVKTLTPIGEKTGSIVLDASYILAKNYFIDNLTTKLQGLGINDIDFIATALGQAMVCEPKKKDKPIVVVDCGHISTSIAVYKGEGLALLSSFDMGGGHISSDLMQILGLSFRDAELIKRKIILTIESQKNDNYELYTKGTLIKAPINMTNQIVKSRIEEIAKVITNILSIDPVFKGLDIYLTGDGISNFRGVKNIISSITGSRVFDFRIPFDSSNNKYQTSKIGLVSLANIVI